MRCNGRLVFASIETVSDAEAGKMRCNGRIYIRLEDELADAEAGKMKGERNWQTWFI